MSSDIITSAPHPRDLRSIVRDARQSLEARQLRGAQPGHAQPGAPSPSPAPGTPGTTAARPGPSAPPSDGQIALDAITRLVRHRVGTLRARVRSVTGAALQRARRPTAPLRPVLPPTPERTGAAATLHVLRVRARLLAAEQRLFDDLILEGAVDDLIAVLVQRSEDEALELLRRQLGSVEPAVSLAALARRIGGLRSQLTSEEYDRAISRLPHLLPEEQQSLHAHLLWTDPTEAAALIRTYLSLWRA